jgi:hypothetical protein
MNETVTVKSKTREKLIRHLQEPDLISDEKVDLIYALLSMHTPSKNDLLRISGFDLNKSFDTATPIDYIRKIEEIYPDYSNGWYINDYSDDRIWGKITNIYNLFAKHIIKTLSHGY